MQQMTSITPCNYSFESIFQKFCSEIFTNFKIEAYPTIGPVTLELFRPSVIRGPCIIAQ